MQTPDLRKVPRWVWIIVAVVALVTSCCCGGVLGAATQAGGSPVPSPSGVTITAEPSTIVTTPESSTAVPTPEETTPIVVDLCAPYLEKAYDYAQSDDMSGEPTIEKVGTPETPLYAMSATWVRPGLTAQFTCRVWQGNLQYAQYSTPDRRVDLITGHTL